MEDGVVGVGWVGDEVVAVIGPFGEKPAPVTTRGRADDTQRVYSGNVPPACNVAKCHNLITSS